MGMQRDDKAIAARLEQVIGQKLEARAEYDEYGQLITLDLSDLDLTLLPPELCQLSNLQMLDLSKNQLTHVPIELCQLFNLQQLYLH